MQRLVVVGFRHLLLIELLVALFDQAERVVDFFFGIDVFRCVQPVRVLSVGVEVLVDGCFGPDDVGQFVARKADVGF